MLKLLSKTFPVVVARGVIRKVHPGRGWTPENWIGSTVEVWESKARRKKRSIWFMAESYECIAVSPCGFRCDLSESKTVKPGDSLLNDYEIEWFPVNFTHLIKDSPFKPRERREE